MSGGGAPLLLSLCAVPARLAVASFASAIALLLPPPIDLPSASYHFVYLILSVAILTQALGLPFFLFSLPLLPDCDLGSPQWNTGCCVILHPRGVRNTQGIGGFVLMGVLGRISSGLRAAPGSDYPYHVAIPVPSGTSQTSVLVISCRSIRHIATSD